LKAWSRSGCVDPVERSDLGNSENAVGARHLVSEECQEFRVRPVG
jgi:hypothetical protein